MNNLASTEIVFHSTPEKLTWAFFIAVKMTYSLGPIKGGIPHNIIYKITPEAQTSHFSLYDPLSTSGAKYKLVPIL